MGCDVQLISLRIHALRFKNANVGVLEPESRVDLGGDFVIGTEDVFEININKVVERVQVLFDESFCLEESGEKEPFVLHKGYEDSLIKQ